MFTATKYANKDQSSRDYVCLSSDTKPTDGIVNGSFCLEMDTGDIYVYDEEGSEWNELCSIKE